MKILLLCYEYPPLGGGGGMGAKSYAEAWARKGHDVRVITGGGPGLPGREDVSGVEVIRVRHVLRSDRATASSAAMLSYLVFGGLHVIRRQHELRGFDVINTHFALPTGPLGWLASRVLSLPHVLTIIGGDIYDPTRRSSPHRHLHWRIVNRFLLRAADRVVAISSDTKERARQYYDVHRPIEVSNYGFRLVEGNGPSEGAEEGTAVRSGEFQLVAIGRLVERKGFRHLIQALSLLPEDTHLWIIGDGPLATDLNEFAERVGVADRLELLGYLAPKDVLAHLRSADCFVLSSLHEGLGIVVQEAMYAGLPIVATNNGGQVDLIQPERNGLLVPPADPSALADAVHRLQKDGSLRRKMGRQNRRDIQKFSVDRKGEEYLEIFSEVVGRRSPAVP